MTSFFYIISIREVPLTNKARDLNEAYKQAVVGHKVATSDDEDDDEDQEDPTKKSVVGRNWKDWLSEGTFFIHGFVYMMVRVAVNVSMTMMPFYLATVTEYEVTEENPTPVQLAVVPLISYIMSLLFSLFLQRPMTRALRNRFYPMLVAIFIIIVTSAPMGFLNKDSRIWIFPLAAFQGIGLAIMLNTATSLISDVIGNDSENSAFVYGSYSLFDKFANGIILLWMVNQYTENAKALRWIMSLTPILCALASYVLTWIGNKYFSHKLAKITGIKG
mmetsp:Transcript_12861/g.19931  ORF Transcript_12861/g.19931 Transcript_12861/m.19931 type:complete len:275 (-) Transcript_12861:24-848(-)